ncbi:hypothetical protein, partial [Escherichia coli]|uniref:hypothetical protein n=1 Tax=Escherichia coli TaxID=562 RepID=UPI001168D949
LDRVGIEQFNPFMRMVLLQSIDQRWREHLAALDYLRQFPTRVRRTVIDGVAPPDMVLPASFSTDNQAALDQLIDANTTA